jgi:phosphatidylglycerophosphate synthase
MVLIVISPMCTNVWDFNIIICGVPCYQLIDNRVYAILDTMFVIIPLSFLTLANIVLMARVVYEKNARRQAVDWRRHRKMAFQLLFISSLYLACWLPLAISLLSRLISLPSVLNEQYSTLIYILNFIPLLLPFVCLNVFPEITHSIRDFLRKQRRNRVAVISIAPQAQLQTQL